MAAHNRLSREENIAHFQAVHHFRYGYHALPESFTTQDKIKIYCPVHGHGFFEQKVNDHKNGHRCFRCSGPLAEKERARKNFAKKVFAVHGNKIDLGKAEYINKNKKVKAICKDHGSFMIAPFNLKKGQGCPACAGRISKYIAAKCYYARIEHYTGKVFYKVGVTKNKISSSLWGSNYTILKEWKYKNGLKAYRKEKKILKKYKEYAFDCSYEVLVKGDSELFTKDVLGLDK